MMTSAWKGLETLTAWCDDMSISLRDRRVVATFVFNNVDEFHMWRDYNRESALVFSEQHDLLGVTTVQVDLLKFMEARFKYGMRKAPPDSESTV